MIKDLKKNIYLLEEYVKLRNKYTSELLTKKVTLLETNTWIKKNDIEILCEYDKELLGVCILNLYRKGEITIFIKNSKKGLGTKLIKKIQTIAKKRNISKTWAWVREDNYSGNIFFTKNDYTYKKADYKQYEGNKIKGLIYEKLVI